MHEFSLARAIADVVTDNADGRQVSNVRVEIGHLRQVVPETLVFCWGLVTSGTGLADTRLEIDHIAAVARCEVCARRWELQRPVLVCPDCGGRQVALLSGEEFLVQSIDVLEVI